MATTQITGTPFYQYTSLIIIAGMFCDSYTAKASASQSQGNDGGGFFVNNFAINWVNDHSFKGNITGTTPSGICLAVPGVALGTPPTNLWTSNSRTTGGSLIPQDPDATFSAGKPAEFNITCKQYEGF